VKKICLITCYSQPDYVRAKTLRAAFGSMAEVDLIIIKNRHKGLLRYPEVMWKLLVARFSRRPDLYFLTFRGYEMLPFVRLATLGKPLVFDEFINLIEWVVYEHHKLDPDNIAAKILHNIYRFWLKSADLIVTDSASHARYSAELMRLPLDKYVPLIVSTDEKTFGMSPALKTRISRPFDVFYYGLMMTPLQGLDTIIAAMRLLKDQDIRLTLVGGKDKAKSIIEQAQHDGVAIIHKKWVPIEELRDYMQVSDVCLAGPFGDSVQAQFVIGGKTYQYMRMGRPVIIGHNLESGLWADKKDALIVERANPQALAEAIIWAQQHPAELAKIGQAGEQLYQAKLSNKVLVEQLELLLTNKHIA